MKIELNKKDAARVRRAILDVANADKKPGVQRLAAKFDAPRVTVNKEQKRYVIPCDGGYSCLGFAVADRQAWAVAEWAKIEPAGHKLGTLAHYREYKRIMRQGAEYATKTGTRCPAELEPRLVPFEGKRVEVASQDGDRRRFRVGKSTGWLPIHLEIARRDSSGGGAAYICDGDEIHEVMDEV